MVDAVVVGKQSSPCKGRADAVACPDAPGAVNARTYGPGLHEHRETPAR
jgi:hypothetical protein